WGGRLSGQADLQVTVQDGQIETNGRGEGMITGVHIPGAPESKPILLKLHPTGEGFRFSSPSSDSNARSRLKMTPAALLTVALMSPQEPKPPHPFLSFPAEFTNLIGTGVLRGIDALTRAGTDLIGRLPQRRTTAAKPSPTPSYLEAQLGLDNVDV